MKAPKRRRPTIKGSTEIKRTNTKVFNLCDKRVCQNFFLKTLAISNGPLINAFKNKNEFSNFFEGTDKRGKHEPSNKLKQEIVDSIINFLNDKCLAETIGKFKKKIICDGTSKSLRNLFDEYKSCHNSSCPSYTSFKKIFYDNNFSLPQERLRQKPAKELNDDQKIQIHNVEVLKLDPIENAPFVEEQTSTEPNVIVTQIPESSASFQQSAEIYEIQFVIPATSL